MRRGLEPTIESHFGSRMAQRINALLCKTRAPRLPARIAISGLSRLIRKASAPTDRPIRCGQRKSTLKTGTSAVTVRLPWRRRGERSCSSARSVGFPTCCAPTLFMELGATMCCKHKITRGVAGLQACSQRRGAEVQSAQPFLPRLPACRFSWPAVSANHVNCASIPPVAEALDHVAAMPSGVGGVPPQIFIALAKTYIANAYSLSQRKCLYAWFGCPECHGRDGFGGPGRRCSMAGGNRGRMSCRSICPCETAERVACLPFATSSARFGD
jgi:hypothetical protein